MRLKRRRRFWLGVFTALVCASLAGCGQTSAPNGDGARSSSTAVNERTPSREAGGGAAGSAAERGGAWDRYDLERDEARGGHTLKKHVGRTDEQLRERLERERNISAASTWTDRDAAETTVAAALRAEHGKVERWEQRGERRANLALHFDAGHVVGRSLRRGEDRVVDVSSAVIVLRGDGDGFYVLTTYPEEGR